MANQFADSDLSYLCMENGVDCIFACSRVEEAIDTLPKLTKRLDCAFAKIHNKHVLHEALLKILKQVDFTTTEMNKYCFMDFEKPYTRNLMAMDPKHYSLLMLCWSPGKESKIHDHPCETCYVKTMRGCVRETIYTVHQESDEIKHCTTRFSSEGQIGFMKDSIGLHKIGNPNRDTASVTLHLYTPPYAACKVWGHEGKGVLSNWEDGKIGFFSVYGHRSPHLEGRPGVQSRLMLQILQRGAEREVANAAASASASASAITSASASSASTSAGAAVCVDKQDLVRDSDSDSAASLVTATASDSSSSSSSPLSSRNSNSPPLLHSDDQAKLTSCCCGANPVAQTESETR